MLAGCVEGPGFQDISDGGIVLRLVLDDLETKVTREGEGALNENLLSNTVDVFFYDINTGEITKEVIGALRSEGLVQLETNANEIETIFGTMGAGAKCGVFVVANFSGTYAGTAGSRNISDIKGTVLPAPTWESLQGENGFLPQASFIMTGEQEVSLGNAQGSTPVYATIGLARVAAKVSFDMTVSQNVEGGWVPDTEHMSVYMVYAMRKATLGAEAEEMPVNANVTYGSSGETIVYSQYKDKILYNTGTPKARIRGNSSVNMTVYSTDYQGDSRPFYTYPCTWEAGSAMEPYMKLIIPWTHGNVTRKYYYKIPFHGNELVRNHWYHISIDVQILGTEEADPPEVQIYYAIADWGGEMDTASAEEITSITSVPATVITAKFLNVPTTEYVMYNEETLTIPIQSSHDIEILGYDIASGAYTTSHDVDANYVGSNPRIYNPFSSTLNSSSKIVTARPDYSQITPSAVSHAFTYDQAADSDGWSVIVTGRESITLTHPLKNDVATGNYDVAPYTIRMRVRHQGEGATQYFTDITVEQRPAIIIKPEANSGGTDNFGYGFVNGGQNNGNTYGSNWAGNNNNYRSADGSWTGFPYRQNSQNTATTWNNWTYYLGSAPSDLSNSSNKNTNMYVIETSVLPTTGSVANYVLGDPRSRTIDNLPGGNTEWSQSKASVQNTTRRITYYYPAGGAEYSNFIAPKFRIASSFGSTQPTTYDNGRRRCASYQEDGYPAGRWRLPTVAEISYMAQLTKDKLIPRLLGGDDSDDTDYWSNNGYVTVPGGTSSSSLSDDTDKTGTRYVRCVYDEWYWEDTQYEKAPDIAVFTWGDQNRNDVRKN